MALKTKIIRVDSINPDKKKIEEAASIIRNNGIVAFPTETVYGLGVLLDNAEGLMKLYKIKSRAKNKPFTVHISKIEAIHDLNCEMPHLATVIIKKFWPGPLTIILDTKDKTKTMAFRMPDCIVAKYLIDFCKKPIVAPSANLSGKKPSKNVQEVLEDLDGKIDAVIDTGETKLGQESTIMDVTSFPYKVLREGAISKVKIQESWHTLK